MLHERGWSLTTAGQPPDHDVMVRLVAMRDLRCEEAVAAEQGPFGDVPDALADKLVGCVLSPPANLHDPTESLLLTLPDASECTLCQVRRCTSLFTRPPCR